jgi:hypothetical protein
LISAAPISLWNEFMIAEGPTINEIPVDIIAWHLMQKL